MLEQLENNSAGKYESDHLARLAQFLNYEISASILFGLSFFAATFLIAALILAGVFIPYLIYVLLKEGRHGWIIFFNLMVVLPLIFSLLFIPSYFSVFILVSAGFFYCYCFLLRMTVNEWISERNWRLELVNQRKKTEDKKGNSEF
ncbi:MAG: hypothetical protein KGZ85_05365 [Ignavibacterium sp.]|nr:hypothetical protein [Ignavibacterium sp.]